MLIYCQQLRASLRFVSFKCILKFRRRKKVFHELSYCASIFQMCFMKHITLQHNRIPIAGKIEQSFCLNFHVFLFFVICLFLCFCLEARSLGDKFIKPYTGLSKKLSLKANLSTVRSLCNLLTLCCKNIAVFYSSSSNTSCLCAVTALSNYYIL